MHSATAANLKSSQNQGNRFGIFYAGYFALKPEAVSDIVLQINSLENAIRWLYKCEAAHLKTVFVDERFEGQIIWQGEVEVFQIDGLPRVSRCYVIKMEGDDGEISPVFLLDQWPVTSPKTAVQTLITLGAMKRPLEKSVLDFKPLGPTSV
jgi:hypothetical protein